MENTRYEKMYLFDQLGKEGHAGLVRKKVAVIGIGATGTVAAEMFVRAGVKKVMLIDRDVIEVSNLQRQSLFTEADVRKMKAIVAQERLQRMNKEVQIDVFPVDLDHTNINLLESVDLILDCTDNFYTRFLVNEFCKQKRIPFVFSAVVGSRGMVAGLLPDGPCLQCLFAEPTGMIATCASEGVIGSAVHMIAGMQNIEAVKILTQKMYESQLLYVDCWGADIEKIAFDKRKDCPVCAGKYIFLSGKKARDMVEICGKNVFQVHVKNLDFDKIAEKAEIKTDYCIFFDDMTIFRDGRVLIKAGSVERAKSLAAGLEG